MSRRLGSSVSICLLTGLFLTACSRGEPLPVQPPPPADSPITSGPAEILSGQDLIVDGETFRLYGIAAPPPGAVCRLPSGRGYDCGRVSATALMDLTAGVAVECQRGRPGAGDRCTAGGYDLSRGMVFTGWALALPDDGRFMALEGEARAARRGMWRAGAEGAWRPDSKG